MQKTPRRPVPRTFSTQVRMTVVARAAFYAITVGAAMLAVTATSVGGSEGDVLMDLSWYTLMLSLVAFLLMVFVNFLASQPGDDAQPAEAVSFADSSRPTPPTNQSP